MTTISDVESRVITIVSEDLGINADSVNVDTSTPLEALAGIDSATLLQMLMGLEEEFGIEIDESEVTLDDLKNVKSIAEMVMRNS